MNSVSEPANLEAIMTLTQLHYAITISETGSFNKAAQILYVSQPSLSNAIHDLEDEFSISIFHRSGRGVSLTMKVLSSLPTQDRFIISTSLY